MITKKLFKKKKRYIKDMITEKLIDNESEVWIKFSERYWIGILDNESISKSIIDIGELGKEKVKDYIVSNLEDMFNECSEWRNLKIESFNKLTKKGYLVLNLSNEVNMKDSYWEYNGVFEIWTDTGGEGTICVNNEYYTVEPIKREIKITNKEDIVLYTEPIRKKLKKFHKKYK